MTAAERVNNEITAIGAKIGFDGLIFLSPKNITEAISTIYSIAANALINGFFVIDKNQYTFGILSANWLTLSLSNVLPIVDEIKISLVFPTLF